MSPLVLGSRSRTAQWARRAGFVALVIGVGAIAWMAGRDVEGAAQARLVRVVVLFASGALAVAAPYLLFPDPEVQRLHLVNPGGRRLLRHTVRRWVPVLVVLVITPVLLAAGGGTAASWGLALEGALALCGVGLFALVRALPLGLRVQRWERGEAGGWYRTLRTRAEVASTTPLLAIPDVLVPSLLFTAEVFLAGAVVAVAGQAVWGLGVFVAPVLLIALASGLLAHQASHFDRAFWASNGAWSDAFYATGAEVGREPLQYAAVYWAPPRFRPAVWACLLSLDRRLPMGRLVVVGLIAVAAVHVVSAPAGVRAASVLAWSVAVNGAIALTAPGVLLPRSLAFRLHSEAEWVVARVLTNVRWLPPLALVLVLLAWWTDAVRWGEVALWVGVYLAVAVLFSIAVSVAAPLRARRSLA